MVKTKKGKCAKKALAGEGGTYIEDEEVTNAPHVLVISRGNINHNLKEIMTDTRHIFEPYTASKLKVKPKNTLKDFVNISGTFHIKNIISFTQTETSYNMRLCKVPRGPTLFFKILSAASCREIFQLVKRPMQNKSLYGQHPLLIMSGFKPEDPNQKILMAMFQNLIPSIDVTKINLNKLKRCLLVYYEPDEHILHIRHYAIRVNPHGYHKSLKKIIKGQKVPNLGSFSDIYSYVTRDQVSESEAELDGPDNEVTLPQNISGRGNIRSHKSAIRLVEIGPRLKLRLIKMEDGLCKGKVLFHYYVQKTPEELEMQEKQFHSKIKRKLEKIDVKMSDTDTPDEEDGQENETK